MSLKKLNERAKEFEYPQERADQYEAGRLTFLRRFPMEAIKDLTIDQYVQGTNNDSFCYWLEFKKILLGIGGGNASKFGLYKAKDGNYYSNSGKNKQQLLGAELDAQFKKIKDGIVQALAYTDENAIDKIVTIDIPVWNMVLQKILTIYYPDKFLTIVASDVLIECARDIKIQNVNLSEKNLIQINYECKKALSALPEYQDWPYSKLGAFIWESYYDDTKRDNFILGSKYGDHGTEDVFLDMFEKSVVSTGFAAHLNLEEFYLKKQAEIKEYLKEQGEVNKSIHALKYFLNLKVGDRIAIKADGSPKGNKGFLSIVGIAEVEERDGEVYSYDPGGLGHLINVKFLKAPVYKEFELGGYGRTIHKLSKPEHIELIFKSDYEQIPIESILKNYKEEFTTWLSNKYKDNSNTVNSYIKAIEIISSIIGKDVFKIVQDDPLEELYKDLIKEQKDVKGKYFNEAAPSYGSKGFYSASIKSYREFLSSLRSSSKQTTHAMSFHLNQILYGPPGTGKTFHSKRIAVEIIDGTAPQDRVELNKRYNQLLQDGRILFITFHQSTSYEDFIEGIKPDLSGNEEDNITYKIEEGIFKKICVNAAFDIIKKHRRINSIQKSLSFGDLYDKLVSMAQDRIDEGENLSIEQKSGRQIEIVEITAQGNLKLKHQEGQVLYTVSKNRLLKLYNNVENFDSISNIYHYFRSIIGGSNASAYWAALNQIYILETEQSPVESSYEASDEDKLEAFKNMDWSEINIDQDLPNYVLIIDEINRGNVAMILGELITLIEEDKRGGKQESMTATLPYSKSNFTVPPNIYLVGTMNTADRSVEALDSALRRRFTFLEVGPNPDIITQPDSFDVDLAELLKTINSRIQVLLDKDHEIGHSYLMRIHKSEDPEKALKTVFEKRIIPLLEEYFYGDLSKIGLILGEHFVKRKETISDDIWAKGGFDKPDVLDSANYYLKEIAELALADFRSIYE